MRRTHTDPKSAQIERLKQTSTSSKRAWRRRTRQSINSPTFEHKHGRGWPRNTKRSCVFALPARPKANVTRLPAPPQKIIGPC
jgi:hypothetical protein